MALLVCAVSAGYLCLSQRKQFGRLLRARSDPSSCAELIPASDLPDDTMAELATLRTARVALDEGLITQEDFDVIKVAFLKASQIKAGLDAGFIREEDYEHARDSFLHSLDFSIAPPSTMPAVRSNSGGSLPRAPSSTAVAAAAAPPPSAPAPVVSRFTTPPRAATTAPPAAAVAASVNGAPAAPVSQQNSNGNGGTADIPTDLARFQRGPSAVGKKSMAGIGLSDQAVALFNCIKSKAAYKWVTYKIDDAGHEVVIDVLGAQNATFDEFVAALPSNQSRYAVFDYAYTNNDTGNTVNKLVFIHWAPDSSTTRSKMMYASTKDFFKGFLDGVGAELQATEVSELNDAEMRDRVHQAITRK